MRMYKHVPVVAQSYKGSKVFTVPRQSLTLREIIKRFVRREALPLEHQGVYIDGLGDLEKMVHLDLTEVAEKVDYIKERLSRSRYAIVDGRLVEKSVDPAPASAAPARHQTESSQAPSPTPTQAESAGG